MNERYAPTVCPICNKEFRPEYYARWGWVIGTESAPIPVCSYKCQRQWEKNPEAKKRKPAPKRIAVRIVETGEVFDSVQDCASYFNASTSTLYRCMRKGITYNRMHIERVTG